VVIGVLWYVISRKKGPGVPQKPQGPITPPPPETPTM